jgi:hypothetical protein
MSEGKFDSHRRLCPDGACIGVIGDDGRCRVCGRAASGGPAPAGFVAAGGDAASDGDLGDDWTDDEPSTESGGVGAGGAKAAASGGFDPARRLCPDGSCIGVIGADGNCTVCGQKAD